MSAVVRYTFDTAACRYEHPDGEYVEHGDYAKLETEAQALREQLSALRARVVAPDALLKLIEKFDSADEFNREGLAVELVNEDLRELARLNGKAVSEGLLRRLSDLFPSDMGDDGSGRAGWLPHVRETLAELRDLLGEGKEHE